MTLPTFTGPGYLGGESPDGLTTVAGVPISARVDVLWRDPADPAAQDVLVQTTQSNADGTWQITDINPDLQYVVRGVKPHFDDVTVVSVVPVRTDVLTFESDLRTAPTDDAVGGTALLTSGVPPFSVALTSPLPYGLDAVLLGRSLKIEGTSEDVGVWESVLRCTDANGVYVDIELEIEIKVPFDEHWSKVLALLHLDGNLNDETGRIWTQSTAPAFAATGGLQNSGALTSAIQTAYIAGLDVINTDFTIEFFVKSADWTSWGHATGLGSLSRAFGKMTPSDVTNYWSVGPNGTGNVAFYAWNNGAQILRMTTHSAPLNELVHISVCRHGSNLYASIGGVVEHLGTVGSINMGLSTTFAVGRYNGQQRIGLQDEIRVTRGIARYTAHFIPPSIAFPSR